jgi:hypothetical protein
VLVYVPVISSMRSPFSSGGDWAAEAVVLSVIWNCSKSDVISSMVGGELLLGVWCVVGREDEGR